MTSPLINFPTWDENLFRYLNSKNTDWLDPIMSVISSHIAWAVTCLLVIGVMIYCNKKWGSRATVFLICGLASNSIINYVVKNIVKRPRPSNALLDIHQLGGVDLSYSFFSAHTSNSICLALFTFLYFRHKYYGILLFLWAFVVAYSRIYLGRHYPIDIMVGLICGLCTGSLTYWLYRKYYVSKNGLKPQNV